MGRNDSGGNWQRVKKNKNDTSCCIRCPSVTIKNMKGTKKVTIFSATTLFSKKREMNEDTVRKDAAQQKKYAALLKFMSSSLLPVCVLCCLMAAVVSD